MREGKRILKWNLMWSSFRFIFPGLAVFLLPAFSSGQSCKLSFTGYVLDESTGIVLPFTSIYNKTTGQGVVADSLGYFIMKDICPGIYQIQFNYIGCEMKEISLSIINDTTLHIFLDHRVELLNEVIIRGKKEGSTAQVSNTITADRLTGEGGKNLADIIESIQGVSTLKTGSGISKPVIHGLFGNRVTILNNGIAQSGQQWGNDHSPEIDPFVADHISVVRGSSALSYSGNSLGGIILVEPGNIPDDTTLSGNINYIYQTNGTGHTLNAHMGRYDRWAAWRITGTMKILGDTESPDYYLTNSGIREEDFAVQLEKKISGKWRTGLYYSMFNTNMGILKGSHIGNVTDLEAALTKTEPFFTGESGSYAISPPRQEVRHHLLKLESHFLISDSQSIQVIYGGQLDNRKEFDVRRGGRSGIPALSLLQNDQFIEGIYYHSFPDGYTMRTGVQLDYTDNANNPETGILPLIPDYRSFKASSFIILKKEQKRLFYEFGARYDLKKLKSWKISNILPRVIERRNQLFQNYSISAGAACRLGGHLKTNLDMGLVLRAPEVNELYSFGLHQGVSGIEIGNPELDSEKSLKLVLSTDWNAGRRLFVQALAYIQNIRDYIYLQPQGEFELTIRGAFPVFIYKQTDARIIGSDLLFSYKPTDRLSIVTKFAALRGTNTREKIPLIYMPASNWSGTILYYLKNLGRVKNNTMSINSQYVFEQRNYVEGQDFLPPPEGYFLLGLNASTNIYLKNKKNFKLSLQTENLLNRRYRDYMNRQRYFANDLGINVILRLSYIL